MFPTNNERLIGISDAFSAFVYGYPSSCPRAHCTPNKSVTTLRYTRRPGPVYTGHACRHLPTAVPWISEDRLLKYLRCAKPCPEILFSAHTCTHIYTQGPAHMSILTIKFKTGNKQGLAVDEDSSEEWKTWRVCCFEKHNVLRLDLKQSREVWFLKEEGGSHSTQRGRRQRGHRNQQSRVWYEESEG